MSKIVKINEKAGRQELIERLKSAPQLYVLISLCTKEPYVVCNPETFDDQVLMFFKEEEAKQKSNELKEEKIPVHPARLESKQMLVFFTGLFTMGVNALLVKDGEDEVLIQLDEFVKRRKPEELPEGTLWVENPQLHLTTLYYAQEMRKGQGQKEGLESMQEEISADFRKGNYIFAVHKEEKGTPLIKLADEKTYQPIFTDVLQFQKFNQENQFRPVVVAAPKLPEVLAKEAVGIVLNLMGVSLPLELRK